MSQELFYKKRCKRLGVILAASCLLNVSLLAFGLYEWQEAGFSSLALSAFRPHKSKLYRQNGKELPTLTQSLRELELLEYDALVAMLADETLVSEGYKKQDLAVAMLGHKYYFDVDRALGGPLAVRRFFTYMSQNEAQAGIILYPDADIEVIKQFQKREKWPFTSEGLLVEYKKAQDPEVKDAFLLSNEYRTLELLLTRGTTVSRDEIFDFVTRVDYTLVKNLHAEMVKSQDFSPEVRKGFLVGALPHSAVILYKTDPRFTTHSLTDKQALMLLEVLNSKEYALSLLEAPRSKKVWSAAMAMLDPTCDSRQTLLERHGRVAKAPVKLPEKSPEKSKLQPKLQQTVQPPVPSKPKPAAKPVAKTPVKTAPKSAPKPADKLHVVQQGDNLWNISKRYGVDIDTIKKYNKLTSDALKPGSTLRIPPKPNKN